MQYGLAVVEILDITRDSCRVFLNTPLMFSKTAAGDRFLCGGGGHTVLFYFVRGDRNRKPTE